MTQQITGLRIPADDDQPITVTALARSDFRAIQAVVGGLFDVIDLATSAATLWLNDEGKLIGLPVNRRATALLWALHSAWAGNDVLCGDVLVTGQPDSQGDTQSVPADLLALLARPASSASRGVLVEVQTDPNAGPDDWATTDLPVFTDWFTAAQVAVHHASTYPAITATRIISATQGLRACENCGHAAARDPDSGVPVHTDDEIACPSGESNARLDGREA